VRRATMGRPLVAGCVESVRCCCEGRCWRGGMRRTG
jgi:hypothetical protein